ncbi:PD-(D/E)XK nuclease family protein [Tumebacillus sp. ITR2]|uniref:PD-(D/E)XK nuclease family protein n=1 Tax=Tumebacillus amylolyticus TaxID=2801339 RepID=A0ABS1J6J4_9BACL|nr:PD-(D/E)XK nuclease family protein [Tumebacillus amylolyticus]MBL0385902.1 PD-(D/E)XK nuclease family protein [Tumebacillus amylolyticus]
MRSLYARLYSLLANATAEAKEDFLTEILSSVLEEPATMTHFFSTLLSTTIVEPKHLRVLTQQTFEKLSTHQVDSRPDLVLTFEDGGTHHIAFLENKLDSVEGSDQLKRYADHLYEYEMRGYRTTLIYLTKHHDPKDRHLIVPTSSACRFKQVRWYEIYSWHAERTEGQRNHFLHYMEELELNNKRRFTPDLILGMQNLQVIWRLMEDCLGAEVHDALTASFKRPADQSNRTPHIRDNGRFLKCSYYDSYKLWVGCGFYFTKQDFPNVCVMIEVAPNAQDRNKVIDAMIEFCNDNPTWTGHDLDVPRSWASIRYEKPLSEFLTQEDQVSAIQDFFCECLKELVSFKQKHPDLPWV